MNKVCFDQISLDTTSALPLANQLAKQITWLIAKGDIKIGEKLPPIREYAKILGIHLHTVRAAYHLLENQELVSVKPKVGTIVKEYIPFKTISGWSEAPKKFIAVLLPAFTDFYNEIMLGIQKTAEQQGYIPMAINCNDNPIYAENIYSELSSREFAGVINISLGFSDEHFDKYTQNEIINNPLIFIDQPETKGHKILIDNKLAIYETTSHLIKHGYTDISLITCAADWPQGKEFLAGYKKALSENAFEFKEDHIIEVPDFFLESGALAAQEIIRNKSNIQAVVAVSDLLAAGVIQTFTRNKTSIPDDIALVGYNNTYISGLTNPPLTSFSVPTYELGVEAMQSLIDIFDGNIKSIINKKLTGKLVIRQSCGCN